MVLFYNILDISALNAYVVWTHINPNWNENKLQRRRLFLKELGKHLVKEQLQTRLGLPTISLNLRSIIEETINDDKGDGEDASVTEENADEDSTPPHQISRKRGRCTECKRSNDKKVRTMCDSCRSFVCSNHSKILCNNCNKN